MRYCCPGAAVYDKKKHNKICPTAKGAASRTAGQAQAGTARREAIAACVDGYIRWPQAKCQPGASWQGGRWWLPCNPMAVHTVLHAKQHQTAPHIAHARVTLLYRYRFVARVWCVGRRKK